MQAARAGAQFQRIQCRRLVDMDRRVVQPPQFQQRLETFLEKDAGRDPFSVLVDCQDHQGALRRAPNPLRY